MALNRSLARSCFTLVFGVILGMALATLLQLSTLQPLESADNFISRRMAMGDISSTSKNGATTLPAQITAVPDVIRGLWENDPEAKLLRLGLVKPEIVSWSPRIIVYHNFLSEEECDKMVELGKPMLKTSTVVDVATGKGIRSQVRTSSGMFLSEGDRKLDFVQAIEKRIAAVSMVPFENGELLQILRYEFNQEYRPHHDYFMDEFNLKRGGQRVATMLMYIREPEEGGQTIFPNIRTKECLCGDRKRPGLCVHSKKGTAVLFWSMKLDGKTDPDSIHGSCPVLKGEKWSSTKWMRQGVFT